MKDVTCPYCDHDQDICQDDGFGCEEDKVYHWECSECEKTFVFTVGILFVYHEKRADCLNGGEHKWQPTSTYPRRYSRMECADCDEERQPTTDEWAEILKDEPDEKGQ